MSKGTATWLNLQAELADARHAYVDMRERAEKAEAALAARNKPCVGHNEDAYPWQVESGKFCSCCGGPVKIVEG